MSRARKGECRIVTSTWSLVEVAFTASEKDNRALDSNLEHAIDEMWRDRKAIKLVEVYEGLYREARHLIREAMSRNASLKPPDAIHLATAIKIKPTALHTYDPDFAKYGDLVGFPITEPKVIQNVLPFARINRFAHTSHQKALGKKNG